MGTELNKDELDAAVRLMVAPEQDAFSVLGIQAERLELAERRLASGKPVPGWTSTDSFERVLGTQRGPADELARYAARGMSFAQRLLAKAEPHLREVLCDGDKVKDVVEEGSTDAKEAIKYVASAIIGALIASLPAVLASAAASISAVIAVILLRRRLSNFCAAPSGIGEPLGVPQR